MEKEIWGKRTIHVKHLLQSALKFWKYILMTGAVCGLLFALNFYMDKKAEIAEIQNQSEFTERKVSVTEAEFYRIKNAAEYQDIMDSQQEYLDNSILMKIDPYHEAVCRYIYAFGYPEELAAEARADFNTILNAYASALERESLFEFVKSEIGSEIDTSYLRECVMVDRNTPYVLGVIVKHYDKDAALAISNAIRTYLEQETENINQTIGIHNMATNTDEVRECVDQALQQDQTGKKTALIGTQTAYAGLSAALLENEQEYLAVYLTERNNPEYVDGQTIVYQVPNDKKVSDVGKKALMLQLLKGFLAGVVLFGAGYSVYYIFSLKVLNSDDLEEMYGIRVLDWLQQKNKDEFVSKLAQVGNIMNLQFAQEAERHNLILSSTCLTKAEMAEAVKALDGNLNKEHIQLISVSEAENEKLTVEQIQNAKGVLLYEKLKKTRFSNLEAQLKYYGYLELPVLGAVVEE